MMTREEVKPCAPKLLIRSANIRNHPTTQRDTRAEVYKALEATLKSAAPDACQRVVIDPRGYKFTADVSRENHGVTAKLFLNRNICAGYAECAIRELTEQLETSYIDTVILSVFGTKDMDHGQDCLPEDTLKTLVFVWKFLEKLYGTGVIRRLGICDMSKDALERFSERVTVKPMVNQVNIEECCFIPPDLASYSAQNGIELLTHNDPVEIITKEQLHQLLSSAHLGGDSDSVAFIIRYNVLDNSRGVIIDKGVLMAVE